MNAHEAHEITPSRVTVALLIWTPMSVGTSAPVKLRNERWLRGRFSRSWLSGSVVQSPELVGTLLEHAKAADLVAQEVLAEHVLDAAVAVPVREEPNPRISSASNMSAAPRTTGPAVRPTTGKAGGQSRWLEAGRGKSGSGSKSVVGMPFSDSGRSEASGASPLHGVNESGLTACGGGWRLC